MDGNKPYGSLKRNRSQEDEGKGHVFKMLHLEVRASEEEAIHDKQDKCIIPTKVTDDYWVWALSPSGKKEQLQAASSQYKFGKWMIFENKITRDDSGLTALDRKWLTIEKMVNDDELFEAKVSTGKGNPIAPNEATLTGVIIIYTKDYTDVKDVADTARKLRANLLDLPKYLYYKTDEATTAGLYKANGNANVSMYRCNQDGSVDQRGSDGRSWVPVCLVNALPPRP